MRTRLICAECIKKQEEIYRLREENQRLKAKLRRQQQQLSEGYFGCSTPAAQQPIKNNTKNDNPRKNGGAKKGHIGKGRQRFTDAEADRIEHIDCEQKICPDCQIQLETKDSLERRVLGVTELKLEKILYKLQRYRCPLCNKTFSAKAPEVLPKFLLNNELLTHVAAEHYVDGIPIKRPVEDLVKQFPDSEEIKNFADQVIPLLSQAMGLRSLTISDDAYYNQASQLKTAIIHQMNQPADHAGIQNIQTIFQQYAHRLYHWVDNRDIPPENNFSERGFRRLVIARKISFGSQSDNGAKTREILMTVLHSLKKRYPDDYRNKFKSCLNQLAQNPRLDPYNLLFANDTS